MNPQELRQLAKRKADEARALIEKITGEKRSITEEEDKQVKSLQDEARALIREAEMKESQAAIDGDLGARSADSQPTDGGEKRTTIEVMPSESRNKANIGHILRALMGDKEARAMSMDIGSNGGFVVPEAVATSILSIQPKDAIVRPRANIIPVDPMSPDQKVHIPAFKQGSTGIHGGMTFKWVAETGTKNEAAPKLDERLMDPKELSGYVLVSNKLLKNASNMSAWIENTMRLGVGAYTDVAYLTGDGVGKPLGVLNAKNTGALKVTRGTASSITFTDIKKMSAKMLPQGRQNAVWICSASALEGIYGIADASNRIIFNPGDLSRGLLPTLWGYPIFVSGALSQYGAEGDLALVDFSYYAIKDGYGPEILLSDQEKFSSNQTVFRMILNTDGQPTVMEPLTLENGNDVVSPYIILK